jgi:hypothetical protein
VINDNAANRIAIEAIVVGVVGLHERPLEIPGKKPKRTADSVLARSIVTELRASNYCVIPEQRSVFPVPGGWWYPQDPGISEPVLSTLQGGRAIDIVVYRDDVLVGLIEVEHDLYGLHCSCPGKEKSTYAQPYPVRSLARDEGGEAFSSFISLERMAVASLYASTREHATELQQRLRAISSNSPAQHNPDQLPIFLVLENRYSPCHEAVIAARLLSLNARLIGKIDRKPRWYFKGHVDLPYYGTPDF